MPKFTVNSDRFDPYHNFKFKIKWDGQYVAGLSKCSALKKTTEVTTWHEAGDQSVPRKIPGKTTYDPITLTMSLKTFRKDVTIEVSNLQGKTVFAYNVYRCWVSEYQALPELDASGNAVMIQTIKLENEGWERDPSVTEPTET